MSIVFALFKHAFNKIVPPNDIPAPIKGISFLPSDSLFFKAKLIALALIKIGFRSLQHLAEYVPPAKSLPGKAPRKLTLKTAKLALRKANAILLRPCL
mgnify:CR=1 FL=1